MWESIFDILLNLKQILFTSDFVLFKNWPKNPYKWINQKNDIRNATHYQWSLFKNSQFIKDSTLNLSANVSYGFQQNKTPFQSHLYTLEKSQPGKNDFFEKSTPYLSPWSDWKSDHLKSNPFFLGIFFTTPSIVLQEWNCWNYLGSLKKNNRFSLGSKKLRSLWWVFENENPYSRKNLVEQVPTQWMIKVQQRNGLTKKELSYFSRSFFKFSPTWFAQKSTNKANSDLTNFNEELLNIGYICVKGPAIITAKHLKLPKGFKCVDPEKYILTLTDDGIFHIRFAIQISNFNLFGLIKTNNSKSSFEWIPETNFQNFSQFVSPITTSSKNLAEIKESFKEKTFIKTASWNFWNKPHSMCSKAIFSIQNPFSEKREKKIWRLSQQLYSYKTVKGVIKEPSSDFLKKKILAWEFKTRTLWKDLLRTFKFKEFEGPAFYKNFFLCPKKANSLFQIKLLFLLLCQICQNQWEPWYKQKIYNFLRAKHNTIRKTENSLLNLNWSFIKKGNFKPISISATIEKTCFLNFQIKHYYYKSGRFDWFLINLLRISKPWINHSSALFTSFNKKSEGKFQNFFLRWILLCLTNNGPGKKSTIFPGHCGSYWFKDHSNLWRIPRIFVWEDFGNSFDFSNHNLLDTWIKNFPKKIFKIKVRFQKSNLFSLFYSSLKFFFPSQKEEVWNKFKQISFGQLSSTYPEKIIDSGRTKLISSVFPTFRKNENGEINYKFYSSFRHFSQPLFSLFQIPMFLDSSIGKFKHQNFYSEGILRKNFGKSWKIQQIFTGNDFWFNQKFGTNFKNYRTLYFQFIQNEYIKNIITPQINLNIFGRFFNVFLEQASWQSHKDSLQDEALNKGKKTFYFDNLRELLPLSKKTLTSSIVMITKKIAFLWFILLFYPQQETIINQFKKKTMNSQTKFFNWKLSSFDLAKSLYYWQNCNLSEFILLFNNKLTSEKILKFLSCKFCHKLKNLKNLPTQKPWKTFHTKINLCTVSRKYLEKNFKMAYLSNHSKDSVMPFAQKNSLSYKLNFAGQLVLNKTTKQIYWKNIQSLNFQISYINLEPILTLLKQSIWFKKNQLIILWKLKMNYTSIFTKNLVTLQLKSSPNESLHELIDKAEKKTKMDAWNKHHKTYDYHFYRTIWKDNQKTESLYQMDNFIFSPWWIIYDSQWTSSVADRKTFIWIRLHLLFFFEQRSVRNKILILKRKNNNCFFRRFFSFKGLSTSKIIEKKKTRCFLFYLRHNKETSPKRDFATVSFNFSFFTKTGIKIQFGSKYKKKNAFSKKQSLKFTDSTVYFLSRYTYPLKYVIFKSFFKKPKILLKNTLFGEHLSIIRGKPFLKKHLKGFIPEHYLGRAFEFYIRDQRPRKTLKKAFSKYSTWSPTIFLNRSDSISLDLKHPKNFKTYSTWPIIELVNQVNLELYQEFFKIYTNSITNEIIFNSIYSEEPLKSASENIQYPYLINSNKNEDSKHDYQKLLNKQVSFSTFKGEKSLEQKIELMRQISSKNNKQIKTHSLDLTWNSLIHRSPENKFHLGQALSIKSRSNSLGRVWNKVKFIPSIWNSFYWNLLEHSSLTISFIDFPFAQNYAFSTHAQINPAQFIPKKQNFVFSKTNEIRKKKWFLNENLLEILQPTKFIWDKDLKKMEYKGTIFVPLDDSEIKQSELYLSSNFRVFKELLTQLTEQTSTFLGKTLSKILLKIKSYNRSFVLFPTDVTSMNIYEKILPTALFKFADKRGREHIGISLYKEDRMLNFRTFPTTNSFSKHMKEKWGSYFSIINSFSEHINIFEKGFCPQKYFFIRRMDEKNKQMKQTNNYISQLPYPFYGFKQTEQITTYISHFPYTFYNLNYKENLFFLYPIISLINKSNYRSSRVTPSIDIWNKPSDINEVPEEILISQKENQVVIPPFAEWSKLSKDDILLKNFRAQSMADWHNLSNHLKQSKNYNLLYQEFINWNKNHCIPMGKNQITKQSLSIFFYVEKIFDKNFLWNSKNIILWIINNSLFDLAASRQSRIISSKFLLEQNWIKLRRNPRLKGSKIIWKTKRNDSWIMEPSNDYNTIFTNIKESSLFMKTVLWDYIFYGDLIPHLFDLSISNKLKPKDKQIEEGIENHLNILPIININNQSTYLIRNEAQRKKLFEANPDLRAVELNNKAYSDFWSFSFFCNQFINAVSTSSDQFFQISTQLTSFRAKLRNKLKGESIHFTNTQNSPFYMQIPEHDNLGFTSPFSSEKKSSKTENEVSIFEDLYNSSKEIEHPNWKNLDIRNKSLQHGRKTFVFSQDNQNFKGEEEQSLHKIFHSRIENSFSFRKKLALLSIVFPFELRFIFSKSFIPKNVSFLTKDFDGEQINFYQYELLSFKNQLLYNKQNAIYTATLKYFNINDNLNLIHKVNYSVETFDKKIFLEQNNRKNSETIIHDLNQNLYSKLIFEPSEWSDLFAENNKIQTISKKTQSYQKYVLPIYLGLDPLGLFVSSSTKQALHKLFEFNEIESVKNRDSFLSKIENNLIEYTNFFNYSYYESLFRKHPSYRASFDGKLSNKDFFSFLSFRQEKNKWSLPTTLSRESSKWKSVMEGILLKNQEESSKIFLRSQISKNVLPSSSQVSQIEKTQSFSRMSENMGFEQNEYIQIDIWTNGSLSPWQSLLNAFKKLFEIFYTLSKDNFLKPIGF